MASQNEKILRLEEKTASVEVQGRDLAVVKDKQGQMERKVRTLEAAGGTATVSLPGEILYFFHCTVMWSVN